MFTVPTPRETRAEHPDCTLDYPRTSRRRPLQQGLMVCIEHGVYVDNRSYASPGTLAAAALIFPRTPAAVHVLADRAACYWIDVLTAWYEAGMPGKQPIAISPVNTGTDHQPTARPDFGNCQWFAGCDRPADHLEPHPFLGFVPACGRCVEIGR